jgi:hypothetical protein
VLCTLGYDASHRSLTHRERFFSDAERSTTRARANQFQSIAELQETQHLGNAVFNLAFTNDSAHLQFCCYSDLDLPNDRPEEEWPIFPKNYAVRPCFLSRLRHINGSGSGIWERMCLRTPVGPSEFISAFHQHHHRRWGRPKPVNIAQLMQVEYADDLAASLRSESEYWRSPMLPR